MITAEHIDAGYSGNTVLRDVNFTLSPGSLNVLIGANGSGKSTLLRTITGAAAPLAGRILLDGKDISSYGRRELARRLAVVFTDRNGGGDLTVEECVAMGRYAYNGPFSRNSDSDKALVAKAIADVGLVDKAHRHLGTLSDGERQKAMIARALAQQTPLIILDEPSAFLDVAGRQDIMRLLRQLADSGHAVLISTHDIAPAIAAADNLMVVDPASRTLCCGSKADVIAKGALDRAFPSLSFDASRGDFVYRSLS